MTSRSKPRFLLPAAILVGCCLLVLLHLARGDDNRRDCELGMSAKLLIDAQSVTIQDPNLGDIKVTRDGDLWMDGEQLDIGHRDREQLQTFERQLRKVVPEIMDITQESIEFAIRLLAETFEAM